MTPDDRIDFTTLRLGSRDPVQGRKVVRCPQCGRKAVASHYRDGAANYTHAGKRRGWFLEVTDSCYVRALPPA